MTSLAQWLDRDPARVSEALHRRPDVEEFGPAPDVAELARRLEHPASLVALAEHLPLPHLQMMEATQALGLGATPHELTELLQRIDPEHDQLVSAVLEDLGRCAVIWPTDDGVLGVASGVGDLWPMPLGLSYSSRQLLPTLQTSDLRQIAQRQGHTPVPTRRVDLEVAIARTLANPVWVRHQVAQMAPEMAAPIIELAQPRAVDVNLIDDDDYFYHLQHTGRDAAAHQAFLVRQDSYRWAASLGLLLGQQYVDGWQMPAEVGLALRGEGYRAPFQPRRPALMLQPTDARSLTTAAGAAVTEFHQQALAVLDALSGAVLPVAKSGGLPLRDLNRLAKTALVEPSAARMSLELAAGAGLITTAGGLVGTTPAFTQWRSSDAAERYALLLAAWWQLPFSPSEAQDPDGKTIRPLHRSGFEPTGDLVRNAVIGSLLRQPSGHAVDFESFEDALLWERPILRHVCPAGTKPWADVWAEAEALGILAAGALTALGRAVPASDLQVLAQHAEGLLPPSSHTAIFGSDLTVMVVGSPTARISRLLDSTAVRESRGAAITWRFSRETLRDAMDKGLTAERLEAELLSVAAGDLPQPLRYLIHDLGRRHGEFRLTHALSVIRSDDVQRLAEAVVDRTLRSLGLRLVAPTVLTSQRPVEESMAALRKAGYLPMAEQA